MTGLLKEAKQVLTCVCECVRAVLSFSIGLLRAFAAGAKLIMSFCLSHSLSAVDKTHRHTQTQECVVIRAEAVREYGNTQRKCQGLWIP